MATAGQWSYTAGPLGRRQSPLRMLLPLKCSSIQRHFPVISKENPFTYISFNNKYFDASLIHVTSTEAKYSVKLASKYLLFPKLIAFPQFDDLIPSGYSKACRTLGREFVKDEFQERFEQKDSWVGSMVYQGITGPLAKQGGAVSVQLLCLF